MMHESHQHRFLRKDDYSALEYNVINDITRSETITIIRSYYDLIAKFTSTIVIDINTQTNAGKSLIDSSNYQN